MLGEPDVETVFPVSDDCHLDSGGCGAKYDVCMTCVDEGLWVDILCEVSGKSWLAPKTGGLAIVGNSL